MTRAPPRNRRDAPPPYTADAQGNATPDFPEPGPSRSRNSTIPPEHARVGSYHSQDLESSAYPSIANEQTGLLGTDARIPEYQTLPRQPPRAKRSSAFSIIFIILITSIVNATLFSAFSELDPISRDRIRKEWDNEIQQHQLFMNHVKATRAEWIIERQEHEKQRSAMIIDRGVWKAEREEQERKLKELHLEIKRDRHDWEQEKWDHEVEWRKRREEEERKLNELRRTIERDRQDWEAEKWNREREWQRRQEEYEREMERRRQKEDEERRRQKEEEEHRWARTRWEDLHPSQKCLSYGTREYTAKLAGTSICRETKAEIHGVTMKPKHCEDKGATWATWVVDFQEPTCITSWSGLTDKGCTGSGIRRYEQHLDDVPWGTDWEQMCNTTPANIHGHHFDRPTSCVNRGLWGMYGYWDINDSTC
ncbi:hypothetical protein BDZ94DRAFT_1264682 [Collybia nuda]|uniref:Uncharacterized protein n=1 Tax=Collybia nuda TaxID=64659 RepID=A0A9P5Y080_9AGAR|nr:hypothetical protein BDZ94DRAFT_1264682 [Collybia nuda]